LKLRNKLIFSGLILSAFAVSACGAATEQSETTQETHISDGVTEETTGTTQSSVPASEEAQSEPTEAAAQGFEWETGEAAEHGMDRAALDALHELMRQDNAGSESKVYSMVTVKDGVIIDEFYHDGYDAESTFPFHSCSKSVTGTLIGIAIDKGYINSIDDPISKYIEKVNEQTDTRKRDITIKDLLTNTSGIDWDEWNSYSVWNAFRSAPNWVDFILGRDLVYAPGEHFTYSTGNTHLLSAVLQNATGKNQLEYAKEVLLEPLGMESVTWGADPQGITDGGNGIVMTARDGARFRQMCLQHGSWEGSQIVPEEWLKESTSPKNGGYGDANGSYGYQWWIQSYKGYDMCYAYGFGGQYIFVVPKLNMVNVITSSNPDHSYRAREYFTEYVLDAVE